MTRKEHLEWAKARAREFLDAGDAAQAIASMASALGEHEAWSDSPMMPTLVMVATIDGTIEAARRFVEGFN